MANSLVIVESPAKVKTIKKFLGSTYEVDASNGHVRDLPKSQLGIDVENDYEPKYITIRGKGDILAKLRKEVKKADKIYLATDPDREGEAISWHLMKALKLDEVKDKKVYRISFNEITKNAVKAFKDAFTWWTLSRRGVSWTVLLAIRSARSSGRRLREALALAVSSLRPSA